MTVQAVPLDLALVDALPVDSYVLYVGADERPLQGLGGLLDWRLGGALSRLILGNSLQGTASETLLTPTGDGLPGPRIFAFGMGPAASITAGDLRELFARSADALVRAGAKSVLVGLPDVADSLDAAGIFTQAFGGAGVKVHLAGK